MTRSFKSLGLALVAMLALGAIVASAASAQPKLTPVPEEYPVTLKGSQNGKHKFVLPGGRNFECTNVTFQGTIANKAAAETSSVTVSPSYTGCTAEILGNIDPVTVTFNSCDYLLTADEVATGTIASEGWEVTGSAHIKCKTAGDKVEVHVWPAGKSHTEATLCTYKIGEQQVKSLDFKLENGGTEGTIRATGQNISVERSSGSLTNCGSASQTATYTGDTKVEGFNEAGEMLKGEWDLP